MHAVAFGGAKAHEDRSRRTSDEKENLVEFELSIRHGSDRLRSALSIARSALHHIGMTLRVVIYSVLALLEPIIVWGTMAIAIIGIGLWIFFGLLAPAPHFPTGVVAMMVVGSGLLLVGYYALMAWLIPD
jgi:hypothetical protein